MGRLRLFFILLEVFFIKKTRYKKVKGWSLVEKTRYKNIKDWFPVKSIRDNQIFLKDGKSTKLFKVEPINFKLKSESEQLAILSAYKQFLKLCNFDMQIIIQTDNIDLESHFLKIKKFKEEEEYLKEMAEDYENLIKNIAKERESISRKFYIAVKNENKNIKDKLISGLLNCGNTVEECTKAETLKVMRRYFKKNSGARKEAKWV